MSWQPRNIFTYQFNKMAIIKIESDAPTLDRVTDELGFAGIPSRHRVCQDGQTRTVSIGVPDEHSEDAASKIRELLGEDVDLDVDCGNWLDLR